MKKIIITIGFILSLMILSDLVISQDAGFALKFDGANDYVKTSLNIDQSGSCGITMEAWVYPTSLSGGRQQIISSDNGEHDWSLLREGSAWHVFNGTSSISTGFVVDLNAWQHLAAVFIPGTGVKVYKNGIETVINQISYDNSDNNIAFGRNPGPWGEFFVGIIDEIRIWNIARTDTQICQNMNRNLTGYEQGLAGYWRLDEGSGNTAYDHCSKNHGTLVNDPTWVVSAAPITDWAIPCDNGDYARDKITINWVSFPTANAYRLDIATDTTEAGIVDRRFVGNVLFYEYSKNLLEDMTYYARLAASTDSGLTYLELSAFSDGITIDQTPPVVYEPEGKILNNNRIRFTITGYDKHIVSHYHIQIASDVFFQNLVSEQEIGSDGIYQFPGVPGTIYYAMAYAVDGAGNQSPNTAPSAGIEIPFSNYGHLGQYYNGYYADNFSFFTINSPLFSRIDTTINFTDTNDSWKFYETPIADRETYSVCWTGFIIVPVSGTYTFYTYSDDASYVFFDNDAQNPSTNNATVNNGGLHVGQERSGKIFMEAGTHPILVVFGENNANDFISFSWENTDAGISKQIVPAAVLRTTGENLPPNDGGNYANNAINFTWAQRPGVNFYSLDIATDTTETSIIDRIEVGNVLTFTYDKNLIEDVTYYARVAASMDSGATYQDPSPFSDGITIDRTPPTINTPRGHLLDNQQVQFAFTGMDKHIIDNYYIQVATDLSFQAPIFEGQIHRDGIYKFKGTPGETYYARGYAIDGAGNESPYSNASNGVSLAPSPDLEVTQIQVQPEAWSGQLFEVMWVVTNSGEGSTNVPEWFDMVYIAADTLFDPEVATALGSLQNVSYLNPGDGYTKTTQFRLPQGIAGSYYIFVVADVNDNQAESDGSNNVGRSSQPMKVNLTLPPDLQVTSFITPGDAFSGQNIQVSWRVKNNADGKTEASQWFDTIYFSTDSVLNVSTDTKLGSFEHQGELAPDDEYSRNETVKLPDAIFGMFYLFVKTDANNNVYEHTWENNNIKESVINITLTPPPDLVVTDLNIPLNGKSGKEIFVSWRVQNQGPGALFEKSWSDRVYLSRHVDLNPDSAIVIGTYPKTGSLEPDSGYAAQFNVTIPNGISGAYHIFVKTDWNNQVFEHQFEDNNVRRSSTPIEIELSAWADLQVTSVASVSGATAGDQIEITWSVKNAGAAKAMASLWKDRIYISPHPSWKLTDAIQLAEIAHSQPLDSPASYTKNTVVKLPVNLSGTYYIYVYTDATNSIYEHTDEGNNINRSAPVAVQGYPPVDLVVKFLSTPDTGFSGQSVTVEWSIANMGSARTLTSDWYDALYLSNDVFFDPKVDMLLKRVRNSASLDAGESYDRKTDVILPNGVSGDYFIILAADIDKRINDINPANNIKPASTPLSITLTDSPDLQVISFGTPSEGQSGQPISVSWTVQNLGSGSISNQTWHDAIYLSTDSRLDNADIRLGLVTRFGDLVPNSSYTENLEIEIPNYVSGAYYLIVKTDSKDNIYEYRAEENNTKSSLINVSLQPPSDLIVTNIIIPLSAVPGKDVTVSWTLQNQGENAAIGWLYDAVYISSDAFWQVDDAMLGIVKRYINLSPGAAIELSLKVNLAKSYLADAEGNITEELPGVIPGSYRAIVRTNIRNNIRESDNTNNALASPSTMEVRIPALQLGVMTTGTLAPDQMKYYQVEVGAGLNLRISLTSDVREAANGVYFAFNKVPTLTDFDYAHTNPLQADQQVLVPTTKAGTYYILLQAQKLPTGHAIENFTILVEALPFSIFSVMPDHGGEGGRVTGTIRGAAFEQPIEIFLKDDLGHLVSGEVIQLINSTEMIIRWNLKNVALGIYDVIVRKSDSSTVELSQAFVVEPQISDQVFTDVQGPEVLPGGRNAVYDIFVTNGNNVDADYIFLTIAVPAYQKFEIRTTDFSGRPIPEDVLEIIEFPMAGKRIGDVAILCCVARNVPVAKTLHATLILYDISGPAHAFTSIFIKAYALSEQEFLWREIIGIIIIRDHIISADPSEVSKGIRALLLPDENLVYFIQSLKEIGMLGAKSLSSSTMPLRYDPSHASNRPLPGFLDCEEFTDALGLTVDNYFAILSISEDIVDLAFDAILIGAVSPLGLTLFMADFGFIAFDNYVVSCEKANSCPDDIEDWKSFKDAAEVIVTLVKVVEGGVQELLIPGVEWVAKNAINSICNPIVYPFDPNEIIGPVGFGEKKWVAANQPLNYTIHFENDSTQASAPAQLVTISEQLDSTVDTRTFRLGNFGFGTFTFNVPENKSFFTQRLDTRDSLGLLVDVNFGIDITTNQAFWRFKSIDPNTGLVPTNPLQGFLLVNDQFGHGKGFVSYVIRPPSSSKTGDMINAKASIVFDNNDPIETPEIFNTIDAGIPMSRMNSLPATIDTTTFLVSWAGTDDSTGSGIRSFALYVAQDYNPFSLYESGVTETSLLFTGDFDHTYQFFTIAADNAGNTEARKSIAEATVTIESTGTTSRIIETTAGWNMISVPVQAGDMRVNSLFPGASSNAFGFDDEYFAVDTLINGEGYWIKFEYPQNFRVYGQKVLPKEISARAGWNLVGPFESPAHVSQISIEPSGIIRSKFFGFDDGYFITEMLQVGKGYWVKLSDAGVLRFPETPGNLLKEQLQLTEQEELDSLSQIHISDSDGHRSILYLSPKRELDIAFDLPPLPTLGSFDVRFTGDRYAESVYNRNLEIQISSASYPIQLKAQNFEGLVFSVQDFSGVHKIDGTLSSQKDIVITSPVDRLLLKMLQSPFIPTKYELSQNYPNPFNPTTRIKYGLPQSTQVQLIIYNILGQKIRTLVDKKQEAGFYRVEWNGKNETGENVASGVYLYMILTPEFTSVKKLILLK